MSSRSPYPSVVCTVDIVLLTLVGAELHVALFKREKEPAKGQLALPGGFVHTEEDQDAKSAALRTLREKAGMPRVYLEQLATFSGKDRDPRGWSVSVVYLALVPLAELQRQALPSLSLVNVEDYDKLSTLPFDHQSIIATAVARVRNKTSYSSLPAHLLDKTFTLRELQAVYESMLQEPVDKVSFRRKVKELDMLEEVPGELEKGQPFRPAQVYRLKPEFEKNLSLSKRGLKAL